MRKADLTTPPCPALPSFDTRQLPPRGRSDRPPPDPLQSARTTAAGKSSPRLCRIGVARVAPKMSSQARNSRPHAESAMFLWCKTRWSAQEARYASRDVACDRQRDSVSRRDAREAVNAVTVSAAARRAHPLHAGGGTWIRAASAWARRLHRPGHGGTHRRDGRAPSQFLDALLEPLLERAIHAARKAIVAATSAQEARRGAESAHAPDTLKERALEITEQAVRLGLEAHVLTEETIGVERAVRYARKGEPWVPRSDEADMDILIAAELACRSRGQST
jgi:hypothetical protein